MKKVISFLTIAVMITIAGYTPVQAVTFDFDDLASMSDPSAISSYMSNLYGSNISVSGAMAGPIAPGDPFGPDPYLFSTISPGNPVLFPFSIEIGFDSNNPIGSIEFEGAVFGDNPGHDFRLWAYSNGGSTLVEVYKWDVPAGSGVLSFDSGLINFTAPIDRLVFSDNFIYDVGIDDFTIVGAHQAGGGINAPLPASTILGCIGLGIVGTLVTLKKRILGHST